MANLGKILSGSCFIPFIFILFLKNGATQKATSTDTGAPAVSYDRDAFTRGLLQARNFVMFYAPWCGHCKNLAPTWDELGKIYNRDGSPVVIAKVDCTVHKPLCMEQDIMGFPTLKLYSIGGTTHDRYTGKRDLVALKKFIKEKVHHTFGETLEPKEAEDAVEQPEKRGGVVHLTDSNFASYTAKGNHFIKFYAPWCGHCKKLAPVWSELADSFAGNIRVSIDMIDCQRNAETCQKYDVRGYPTLLWFSGGKRMGQFQSHRTLENLQSFVEDNLAKEGQEEGAPPVVSNLPELMFKNLQAQKEGKILDLTDHTFNAQLKHSKLIFVKFYAPWCGHCKKLAPAWSDLASAVADQDVAIAKVDCTQHRQTCTENGVRGYPTLKLFRDGAVVNEYKGPRALGNLLNFVNVYTGVGGGHDEL